MPVVRQARAMSPPPGMTMMGPPVMLGPGPVHMGPPPMTMGPGPIQMGPPPMTMGPGPVQMGPPPMTMGPAPMTMGPMGAPMQLAPGPVAMGAPPAMMMPAFANGPPGAPQPPPPPQPQQQQEEYGMSETVGQNAPLPRGKHIPLARCRVLYLGSAVPTETVEGIEAVQQPLRERYPIDNDGKAQGIDCWLTIFSSGLSMQYVTDMNSVTWFPISSMHVSAAIKCIVNSNSAGERIGRFTALDSSEADGSDHPPMFAAIMRRTKGVKVLECHTFICKTKNAAMALVQSCTHAYRHKEGWNEGSSPPIDVLKASQSQMHLVAAEPNNNNNNTNTNKNVSREFFEPPAQQGYFYTTKKDVIKNYNVQGQGGSSGGSDRGAPRRAPSEYEPRGPPPGAPMMMGPMYGTMGAPGHLMMPAPPQGYFADWDRYPQENFVHLPNLAPFVVPAGDPRMMEQAYMDPRGRRKKPTKGAKQRGRKYDRALSPRGQPHYAHRRRSPSPHYYSDDDYSDDDAYYERYHRSRAPPAGPARRVGPPPRREDYYDHRDFPRGYDRDFIRPQVAPVQGDRGNPYYAAELNRLPDERPRGRRGRGGRDDQSDLILYGERYMSQNDDYPLFQAARPTAIRRTGSQERYVEYDSHFTKDIWMRDGNNMRHEERGRSPPASPRAARRVDDYRADYRDLDDYRRQPPQEAPRARYPRSDHVFGQSMAEERRLVGDADYPDPYRMNYAQHIGDNDSDYGYHQRIVADDQRDAGRDDYGGDYGGRDGRRDDYGGRNDYRPREESRPRDDYGPRDDDPFDFADGLGYLP